MALDPITREWLAAAQRGERRREPRHSSFIKGKAEMGGFLFHCIVTDLSTGGAGAWCAVAYRARVGDPVTLRLPHRAPRRARVRQVSEEFIGMEFLDAALPGQ